MRLCVVWFTVLAAAGSLAADSGSDEVERRIIGYVRQNIQPGKPLVLSRLYNEVFTSAEERRVLDKLNRVFFRIPLFLIDFEAHENRLPTLAEIAEQFDLYGPDAARVVLSVMDSDPRVPSFVRRDPSSGELLGIDAESIGQDPRFNKLVERALAGWEGRPMPEVTGRGFDGTELSLASFRGKVTLLYVWFTNCPPCVRMAPELAALHDEYQDRGFTVVGANADRILGLSYDDAARAEYLKEHSIDYPNFHLTEEGRSSLGNVNIFPTMFLIDRDGMIANYFVNFQPREILERAIESVVHRNTRASE